MNTGSVVLCASAPWDSDTRQNKLVYHQLNLETISHLSLTPNTHQNSIWLLFTIDLSIQLLFVLKCNTLKC